MDFSVLALSGITWIVFFAIGFIVGKHSNSDTFL